MLRKAVLLLLLTSLFNAPALAQDLKIIFSQYTPPYVFESGDGIVVGIVRAALEPAGYTVVPVYVPIGRGFELFAQQRVDGTAIITTDSGLDASYSDVFMHYHNHAIGLKSRGLRIESLDDLRGRSIVAFQNAHKYLGAAFGEVVAGSPDYKEMANQETQTLMLLLGRVELAIMDESIFKFYHRKLVSEGRVSPEVEVEKFQLFEPTGYRTAFVDPAVRDHFDAGLRTLRDSGRYDRIYAEYIDRYFHLKQ